MIKSVLPISSLYFLQYAFNFGKVSVMVLSISIPMFITTPPTSLLPHNITYPTNFQIFKNVHKKY